MTPVQQIELQALKEFKEVAKKNGITFFLRGGSVMGAVKYNGFIPWDDDMDIAVPREQYNKLVEVFSGDWSDNFWMASYQKGDEIHAYFPRILIKEHIRKTKKLPQNNHLGFSIIDILPLDNVPNTAVGRKLFKYQVGILRALGAVWTVDVKDTIMIHSSSRQKAIRFIKHLGIQRFYTQNQIYDILDKIYSKRNNKTNWKGTITGSLFDKELFSKDTWGNGIMLKFEDTEFRVPTKYDDYLKQLYGQNYATEEPNHKKSHLEDKRIN